MADSKFQAEINDYEDFRKLFEKHGLDPKIRLGHELGLARGTVSTIPVQMPDRATSSAPSVQGSEVQKGQCEAPMWERVSPKSSSASGAMDNPLRASSVAQNENPTVESDKKRSPVKFQWIPKKLRLRRPW